MYHLSHLHFQRSSRRRKRILSNSFLEGQNFGRRGMGHETMKCNVHPRGGWIPRAVKNLQKSAQRRQRINLSLINGPHSYHENGREGSAGEDLTSSSYRTSFSSGASRLQAWGGISCGKNEKNGERRLPMRKAKCRCTELRRRLIDVQEDKSA